MKFRLPASLTFKSVGKIAQKAVASTEGFHLDDSGKHVIFRTINGKVVPIQVTPEEYLEWRVEQGDNLDPANQKQLRTAQDRLEVMERAAEIGGPELQAQYEKHFAAEDAQYQQAAQAIYQQSLQQEAARRNVTPERLHEDNKRTYEESKDRLVKRTELPDRGWESYTENYVNKMIESAGIEEKSGAWYVMQAFDLMLRKAGDEAKAGSDPQQISLDSILESELQDFSGLKRHWDNYAKHKVDQTDFSVESNMFKGVEWLKENLQDTNETSAFLRDAFDSIYNHMYHDFNPSKTSDFARLQSSGFNVPTKMIPKELPPTYGPRESSALIGFYRNFKGSKRTAAARATLHAVARIYDSIPPDEKVAAYAELSDGSRGLHAIHKSSYLSVYHDKETLGIDVDVESEMEDILRIAARHSEGSTQDKVQALKRISKHLGRIDGAHQLAAMGNSPSQSKFRNKWQDSSLEAGRRKGDGPDLLATLTDENRLKAAMLTNSTLKVMHSGATPSTNTLDTEEHETITPEPTNVKPEVKKPTKKPNKKIKLDEGIKFSDDNKSIITDDGYTITPSKDAWKITTQEGDLVGEVYPDKGVSAKDALPQVLRDARASITEYNKESSAENRMVPGAMFGFFNQNISHQSKKMLSDLGEKINNKGLSIKEKIPGVVYEVQGASENIQVAYRKKDESILFLNSDMQVITPEEAQQVLDLPRADEAVAAEETKKPAVEAKKPTETKNPAEVKEPVTVEETTPVEETESVAEEPAVEEITTPVEPVEESATPAVEVKAAPLKVDKEFSKRLNDKSKKQMQEISNVAAELGLQIENTNAGDFSLVNPETKQKMIVAAKKNTGELFVMDALGKNITPYTEKDLFKPFDADKYHEMIVEEPTKRSSGSSKRKKTEEKIPKAKPPAKPIPWDDEEYGTYGANIDGTPTGGFARWKLHNEGYKNPTQSQIQETIKKYKGIAPRNMSSLDNETIKSILVVPKRNFIPNFRLNR